ncbi:DUF254-domain-containing protein [Atractiella rhizophila]|nr:DUF254-domain-containing protein [Atractiella rhizophila]
MEELELDEDRLPPSVFSPFSRRKYFVLSNSGKLVWASEDEEEATGQVGVMRAIISIFEEDGDMIRYVKADQNFRIAFMRKSPLYLVAASDWGEPESVLRSHMELIHFQILSVVSSLQLTRLFSKQANFDLRRMLSGTENFLSSLIDNAQMGELCFTHLMASLTVFKIDSQTRSEVGKALLPEKKLKDLLYLLILANGKILTLVRPRKHSVHPTDLFILLNTILSSPSLTSTESWLPICLPKFNDQGFLHSYVAFPQVQNGDSSNHGSGDPLNLGLIFVSANREAFVELQELKESVMRKLAGGDILDRVREGTKTQGINVGELGIPGLRHFVYKSRTYVQIAVADWDGIYDDENLDNRRRLIVLYQKAHDAIKGRLDQSTSTSSAKTVRKSAAKLVYFRTEWEIVLGTISSERETYLALSHMLPKTAVMTALASLDEWVKKESDKLFLINAPSF